MVRSFAAAPFTTEDIGRAYPLIRATLPDVDLAAWRGFARGIVDLSPPGPAGGVCLRSEAGYLCGVLTYRIDRDLRHGTALTIDVFAALDVTGEEAAFRALLQTAEEKAHELRCAAVRIHLERPAGILANRLSGAGYACQTTIFCKSVGPCPRQA